jgi:hypothetical protein
MRIQEMKHFDSVQYTILRDQIREVMELETYYDGTPFPLEQREAWKKLYNLFPPYDGTEKKFITLQVTTSINYWKDENNAKSQVVK